MSGRMILSGICAEHFGCDALDDLLAHLQSKQYHGVFDLVTVMQDLAGAKQYITEVDYSMYDVFKYAIYFTLINNGPRFRIVARTDPSYVFMQLPDNIEIYFTECKMSMLEKTTQTNGEFGVRARHILIRVLSACTYSLPESKIEITDETVDQFYAFTATAGELEKASHNRIDIDEYQAWLELSDEYDIESFELLRWLVKIFTQPVVIDNENS